MAIGSKDKGDVIDVKADAATVLSGSPVRIGHLVGVAAIDAKNDRPGNESGDYWTSVYLKGEFLLTVAGTLAIGNPVFTATAAAAGAATAVTLTNVEGTTSKKLFGFITGISPTSGKALVTIAGQSLSIGASA